MKQSLEQIISDCIKGNRSSQQELYLRLSPRMYAVCLQYTRNQMEAEDCLQEGFVKVFTKLKEFSNNGSFEGWVRRIMVNTAIEHYRRNKSKFDTDEIEEASSMVSDTNNDPGDMNASYLIALINQLPPQYKIVFSLFAIEGYSHDEISKELNIAVGTSKSNLARARSWLQNKMEEDDYDTSTGSKQQAQAI